MPNLSKKTNKQKNEIPFLKGKFSESFFIFENLKTTIAFQY